MIEDPRFNCKYWQESTVNSCLERRSMDNRYRRISKKVSWIRNIDGGSNGRSCSSGRGACQTPGWHCQHQGHTAITISTMKGVSLMIFVISLRNVVNFKSPGSLSDSGIGSNGKERGCGISNSNCHPHP